MKTLRPFLLVPLLVAACSSGSSPTAAPVQPGVIITEANALEVAGSAWRAAFDLVRVARLAGGFLQVAPPTPPSGAPNQAIVTQTLTGPDGGEAILTFADDDRDGSYTTGDEFTINFADYAAEGLSLTGAIVFDAVHIQGSVLDGLGWILTARMHALGLAVTRGEVTVPLNGSFVFGRERRTTVDLLSVAVDTAVPFGNRTLAAGNTMARNDYTLDFRMGLFAQGAVDDAALGGVLTFASRGALTGLQALPDPSTGVFEVQGANGTSLTIVPIDFFNVEIQVDADGDGEPETTLSAEWAQL